ncbi:hypothetical protein ACIBL5_06480 [Streptomyces sp. NPDC050516]|uniref:hypothetical protein n=1 Tax=Streptomyces sp. NPDC050516 TaxID=3365621 RepID=UPI0037A311B1
MNRSAHPANTPTTTAPVTPARAQNPPRPAYPGITAEEAFDEIARIASLLCEHLADHQWRTAERIRHLAENYRTTTGAS